MNIVAITLLQQKLTKGIKMNKKNVIITTIATAAILGVVCFLSNRNKKQTTKNKPVKEEDKATPTSDTLKEKVDELSNDPDFSATIMTEKEEEDIKRFKAATKKLSKDLDKLDVEHVFDKNVELLQTTFFVENAIGQTKRITLPSYTCILTTTRYGNVVVLCNDNGYKALVPQQLKNLLPELNSETLFLYLTISTSIEKLFN